MEEGGGGCFQGGPLWLQQASVAPAVHIYPTPHPLCPLCPNPPHSQPVTGVADWLTASKWHGPEGLVRVWPRGSSPPCTAPRGLTLDHDTYRDTQSAAAVQAGWVTEVEAAASAHYG